MSSAGLAGGRIWALQEDEEVVPFADYSPDFRLEAQERNPRVKCFDLRQMTSWKTPNEKFFVFHQSPAPRVDGSKWKLRVGGFVGRPAEFSL